MPLPRFANAFDRWSTVSLMRGSSWTVPIRASTFRSSPDTLITTVSTAAEEVPSTSATVSFGCVFSIVGAFVLIALDCYTTIVGTAPSLLCLFLNF
jgi:hypothetical protein